MFKKTHFFLILLVLLFSSACNNDKEVTENFKNRLLKISTLTSSQNSGTSYINVLEDSIRIINFDLNASKIKNENKQILKALIDSINENLHKIRLTNCIINNKYTISSKKDDINYWTTCIISVTVLFKEKNECELITSYLTDFGLIIKHPKREFATYKYIGNNNFEISNKFILKITDEQKCKAEISVK
jgi:hypothetical protein